MKNERESKTHGTPTSSTGKSARPKHGRETSSAQRTTPPRRSGETSSTRKSARPNHGRPNPEAAKARRNIYRKSKYYQRRLKKLYLLAVLLGLVLVLIAAFLIYKGVTSQSADTAREDSQSTQASDSAGDGSVSAENDADAGDGGQDSSEEDAQTDSEEDEPDGSEDDGETALTEPVSLTLSVVGDCTLGTDEAFNYSTSLNAYYDSYGADYFMQNVRSIFEADDLTIANFEGTLTESTERKDTLYAFKAPASYAQILSGSSVEAVNTANNHSHDYGEQGFSDTLSALDSAGITHFGYDETAVLTVKGVKVGLVGIYELYDHLEREQQLKDNIAKVKEEGAQLIVVIFHWGNEKETVPDSNQTTLGRLAIDEGADLVCGHHPHVLQGIETYKGKNIVYSLANFCFGGNSAPSDTDTMIFQQTFTITSDGVQDDNVTNIIPCSVSSVSGYNNYQPTPAEGDEKTRILNKIEERSSQIPSA